MRRLQYLGRKASHIAGAVLISSAAIAAATSSALAIDRVTVGTNPAGTIYAQIGGAMAALIQSKLDIQATARPHSGTSVYLPLLHRGEIEFGLNSTLDSTLAYNGEGVYEQPLTDLRAGMLVFRANYGYYVQANSGMENVADLAGKETIVTFRAIASFDRFNRAILASAGLGEDDLEPITVAGIPDAVRALVEGEVDATPVIIGIPAIREADAAVSGGLRVLSLGEDDTALNELPGIATRVAEPAPPLVGVTEPTKIATFDVYLNTGPALTDDEAYEIIKTLHTNWEQLQKDLPPLRSLPADKLAPSNMSHPYHPGAVRYFKEAGLWTDAHQARQDELLAIHN